MRILLFRPLLVRFCLSQPRGPTVIPQDHDLASRLIRNCAELCVSNAQKLIALVSVNYHRDGNIGLIPAWWYRCYYIYSAATILIAAKLQPELSIQFEVLEAW